MVTLAWAVLVLYFQMYGDNGVCSIRCPNALTVCFEMRLSSMASGCEIFLFFLFYKEKYLSVILLAEVFSFFLFLWDIQLPPLRKSIMSCFNCCNDDEMQRAADNSQFMGNNASGIYPLSLCRIWMYYNCFSSITWNDKEGPFAGQLWRKTDILSVGIGISKFEFHALWIQWHSSLFQCFPNSRWYHKHCQGALPHVGSFLHCHCLVYLCFLVSLLAFVQLGSI